MFFSRKNNTFKKVVLTFAQNLKKYKKWQDKK